MGYKIVYDLSFKSGSQSRYSGNKWKRIVFIGLFVLLVMCALIGPIREQIVSLLFPGDVAATDKALQAMSERITAGVSLTDAFAAFCQEIVSGA